MARPIISDFRSMPGPDVVVTRGPAEGGTQGGADPRDLVLGLERADPELLVLGQLVQDVEAGVIGYVPRNSGSPLRSEAATRPQAAAVLPVMLAYSPVPGRPASPRRRTRRAPPSRRSGTPLERPLVGLLHELLAGVLLGDPGQRGLDGLV